MSNLIRRSEGTPARPSPSARANPSTGRDVTTAEWSGDVLTPAQMGVRWPSSMGRPAVSMAVEESGARRRSDGSFYKRRQAWAADPSGVVLARSHRDLVARPDGRFQVAGTWSAPIYRTLTAAQPPIRRVGDVADDAQSRAAAAGGARQGRESDADHALSFLPGRVREGVEARANPPELFCAEAVRHSRSDGSVYWTVTALKHNASEAIVVLASRQDGSRKWQVEQFVYQLTNPTASIGRGR